MAATGIMIALVVFAGLVAVFFVVALILGLGFFSRKRTRSQRSDATNLTIDIESLTLKPVRSGGPQLEIYGIPVRLVAFILAPSGRNELPEFSDLRGVSDHLVPGLASLLDFHQPIFRRWPPQLSTTGFAQAFFANMMFPGDHGKGTCWCGVAGKFSFQESQMLAGLVFHSDKPNALGSMTVEHEGKWNDLLRISVANE